jgi:hypothetical protein
LQETRTAFIIKERELSYRRRDYIWHYKNESFVADKSFRYEGVEKMLDGFFWVDPTLRPGSD